MATIFQKRASWFCQFMYSGARYNIPLGPIPEDEARATASRVDYVLMRLRQGLMALPDGVDLIDFVRDDGRPAAAKAAPGALTLTSFCDAFLQAIGQGSVEANTLATTRIHLDHCRATLGDKFIVGKLTLGDLQKHVDRRRKVVVAVTIRKEVATLRTAWAWNARMGRVAGIFPNGGLVYAKEVEKLPFMTRAEIERRLSSGGAPETLWECLYLTVPEVEEFLAFVKGRKAPPWFYPMLLFAAHTGARRSEMLRARVEDIDLGASAATIREKKRVKGRLTTRRVPLSSALAAELAPLVVPGRAYLFGDGIKPISVQAAQKAFPRAMRESKWAVMNGYHVLRHSCASALAHKNVDQRVIDQIIGHSSAEMSRRYRHIRPDTAGDAVASVFG